MVCPPVQGDNPPIKACGLSCTGRQTMVCHGILCNIPKIANFGKKYFILSKIYIDEAGIK